MTTTSEPEGESSAKTLFGFELTSYQDGVVNYLIPSLLSCALYICIIAADIAVIFRHFKGEDPIWGGLTIYIIFQPVLLSYILIITDWDLWPQNLGWGSENLQWFLVKTFEHLNFPIWNIWRYAERIFWSIEALRSKDEESRKDAKSYVDAPRTIELYIFLQAFLHALPQILFQLYLLLRNKSDIHPQTKYAQIISCCVNLAKLAVTTTYYQRFKSQKVCGKQYPWLKTYKKNTSDEADKLVVLRRNRIVETSHKTGSSLEDDYDIQPEIIRTRRISSDIYLETVEDLSDTRNSMASRIDEFFRKSLSAKSVRTTGPSQPDFNISRVRYNKVKGLTEDDFAGKLTSFLWWTNFLFARILAVSVFAYFYLNATIYLLSAHVILVILILSYNIKDNYIKRSKIIYFLFIGIVYVFCIIEFKIKFKKSKYLYLCYFGIMYLENIIICLVWYYNQLESLEDDYWFRYMFVAIIISMLCSCFSMVTYFCVSKPKSVEFVKNPN